MMSAGLHSEIILIGKNSHRWKNIRIQPQKQNRTYFIRLLIQIFNKHNSVVLSRFIGREPQSTGFKLGYCFLLLNPQSTEWSFHDREDCSQNTSDKQKYRIDHDR